MDGSGAGEDPDGDDDVEITHGVAVNGNNDTQTVTIAPVSSPVAEGSAAEFRLSRTGATTAALTVNVNVAETGSVLVGAAPATVEFAANSAEATLSLPTSNEGEDEPDSNITVTVQAGTGYEVGPNSMATVTVADDDAADVAADVPVVRVRPVSSPVVEGVAAEFHLSRTGATTAALTVNVNVMETGSMLTGTVPRSVEIPAESAGTRLSLPTSDDTVMEPRSTVTVLLLRESHYGVHDDSLATVTVRDNDTPVVTIAPVSNPVAEGAAAEFRLSRTGATTAALTVNVNVAETGSVLAGMAPATVEFAADSAEATLSLPTSDDAEDEPDSDVIVTVQAGTGYEVESSTSTARVTVEDDDVAAAPEVTIAPVSSPVAEGEAAEFRLTRTGVTTAALTVNVNVSETGSVLVGSAPATVAFAADAAEATLSLPTSDDAEDEPDSDITVTVRSGMGYEVGAISTATVRVADDDAAVVPVVTIAPVSSPVAEGEAAEFRLSRTGATTAALTVGVNVLESGSVLAGRVPATMEFAADSAEATLSLPTSDDAEDEPNSVVWVGVRPGTGYEVGANSTATVTVEDDDATAAPVVTIAPVSSPVAEGAAAEFRLSRTGATTAALTVSVNVAETGSVLVGAAPVTVEFAANGAEATLSLPTSDDGEDEPASDITVTVQAGTGYEVGANSTATVRVEDDDAADVPVVRVRPVSSLVVEGLAAEFRLSRTGATTEALTVRVNVAETGSVLAGMAPATVAFAAESAETTLSLPTSDDTVAEPHSTVTVILLRELHYGLHDDSLATVTVRDNDTQVVRIAPVSSPVAEGAAAEFRLSRTGATTEALTVNVNVAETGSVLAGMAPATVAFAAESAETTLSLPTWNNALDEPDSDITVTVQAGTGYEVGAYSTATVTVEDDDDETVALPGEPTNLRAVAQGDTAIVLSWTSPAEGFATITGYRIEASKDGGTWSDLEVHTGTRDTTYTHLGLSPGTTHRYRVSAINPAGTGASSNPVAAMTASAAPVVTIALVSSPVAEGTAAEFRLSRTGATSAGLTVNVHVVETGSVMSGTAPATVAFAADSAEVTLSVPTSDDATDEPDSDITVTVQAGTGYEVGAASTATVTVRDNDEAAAPEVTIARVESPVTEGAAAEFRLSRTGVMGGELTVNVRVVETGSVMSGTAPATVAFAADSAEVTLSVPTSDDATDEPDSDITVTVQAGTGYEVGAASTATVTVEDDDAAPEVTIARVESPVTEGAAAEFRLSRTGATSAGLTVNVHVVETGSVMSGTAPATVAFAADSAEVTLSVPTSDDATDEPDSDITVTVQAGTGYEVGAASTATVTVEDDDAAPEVTIARVESPVTEGAAAEFRLSRTGATSAGLTVNVHVVETGSVMSGTAPATVAFAADSAEVTLSVPTSDDATDEPDSDITVTVQAGTGYEVGAASTATVTVRDNDEAAAPEVTIARVESPVTEGAAAEFRLSRTGVMGGELTVNVRVVETGSVMSGTAPATVAFAADSAEVTLSVPTSDDATDEPDSDITVTVQAGTGYEVGAASTATVTVEDDDAAPEVTIARVESPVTEGAAAEFRLSRTGATSAGLTVNVRVVETGSVMSGTAPATVAFAADSAGVTLSVPTSDDASDEPDSDITVTVQAGTGYEVGAASTATVTVRDAADEMGQAWLARFGRTVASQVVEGIGTRLNEPVTGRESAASHLNLAGQHISRSTFSLSPQDLWNNAQRRTTSLARSAYQGGSGTAVDLRELAGLPGRWGRLDRRTLLAASSFRFTSGGGQERGGSGTWTAWGHGMKTGFRGVEAGKSLEGGVVTGLAGLDYQFKRALLGMAVSHSLGNGTGEDRGVETSFTSLHPYLRIALTNRLSAWGLLGYGRGKLSVAEGDDTRDGGAQAAGMRMGAFGARGSLLSAGSLGLSLKTDAFMVSAKEDAATGEMASASRLRFAMEGSLSTGMASGGSFGTSLEAGLRHDGGDAETGTGVEVGGSIRYTSHRHRLRIEVSGRRLVAHQDEDFEEWGVGGSVILTPGGKEARGLSVLMRSSWGALGSGVNDLWSGQDMQDVASRGGIARAVGTEGGGRSALFNARLEYAIGMGDDRLLMAPFADIGIAGGADRRAYRVGWRLNVGRKLGVSLVTDLTPKRLGMERPRFGLEASLRR